jgi:uncharacterized OB-fold protein
MSPDVQAEPQAAIAVAAVPVADGLFTWGAEPPRLIGSRCPACGATTFPKQPTCPRCTRPDMEERLLSPTGTLWTFTVQGFRPKSPYAGPEDFEPYGVGYVELPDGVMVEARLTENDPERLEIGGPMELVIVPFGRRGDGTELVTFAFAPAARA